jgi:predicted O-methyltransferase YrrM
MKSLPLLDVDCTDLLGSLYAPIRYKLLIAAIELKVFNELSEPVSAEAVAQAIAAHPGNTVLFLDVLVTCDFLEKKNSLYWNTPVAQAFLVESSPTYLGTFLVRSSQMILTGLGDLPALVKKGPPPLSSDADMASEEMWAQFAVPMANYARSGAAQQVVEVISALPEFPSFNRMLDLGGGPGIYGIAIVAAHPDMKGVIFDQPTVVKVAEAFIKEYGLQDRMDVTGGDYFHDSIGGGYDLIWACATLNFYKDDLDSLMQKIYSALNPGGVFASLQDGLTDERTKPGEIVLGAISYALMGQDMRFDQGFIADSMLYAGFKSVRSRTILTPGGPMDLDIGRKAK